MNKSKHKNLNLLIGNLFLAICLATVPTAITYGTLSLHGLNICRTLTSRLELDDKEELKSNCNLAAWDTTKSYIFLIGFFITLPTWLWIYLSVMTKKNNTSI